MENLAFNLFISIVGICLTSLGLYLFLCLQKTTHKLKETEELLHALKKRHELNPSLDVQLAVGELLNGGALFKIERLDQENIFYRRR